MSDCALYTVAKAHHLMLRGVQKLAKTSRMRGIAYLHFLWMPLSWLSGGRLDKWLGATKNEEYFARSPENIHAIKSKGSVALLIAGPHVGIRLRIPYFNSPTKALNIASTKKSAP